MKRVFVFNTFGTNWCGMGLERYRRDALFRITLDQCHSQIEAVLGWSLMDELRRPEGAYSLHVNAALGCPALTAVQIGLFRSAQASGLVPDAIAGTCKGEAAAAYAAGILDLGDAFRISAIYSVVLAQSKVRGRMLGIAASSEQVQAWLQESGLDLFVAADLHPQACLLSGMSRDILKFARELSTHGTEYRFIALDTPAHCSLMSPARECAEGHLTGLRVSPETLPYFSSVSGRRLSGLECTPNYWWRLMSEFSHVHMMFASLLEDGYTHITELGANTQYQDGISKISEKIGIPARIDFFTDHDEQVPSI